MLTEIPVDRELVCVRVSWLCVGVIFVHRAVACIWKNELWPVVRGLTPVPPVAITCCLCTWPCLSLDLSLHDGRPVFAEVVTEPSLYSSNRAFSMA